MKIAFAGKGGAGKTSLSGTLARVLARRGDTVLALDDDPAPTLALSLGVDPEVAMGLSGMPGDLAGGRDENYRLKKSIQEIVAEYGHDAPDGIRLLIGAQPKVAGRG